MVLVSVSGDILVDACRPIYTLSYDETISFYMTHLTMLSNFTGYITVNVKAESEKTCRVATVAYFKIICLASEKPYKSSRGWGTR
jgi:hypothetical protein